MHGKALVALNFDSNKVTTLTLNDLYHSTDIISSKSSLCIGNFDGIHLGHQEIIANCLYYGKHSGSESIILSFAPHPASILKEKEYSGLIMDLDSKIKKLLDIGIQKIILLKFDEEFSRLSAEDFIKLLVYKLNPTHIVTGENFHYGYKKSGDIHSMHNASDKYSFVYHVINQLYLDNHPISSSLIRHALNNGLIEKANKLLGSRYSINGKIIKGSQFASSHLNIPTANFIWPHSLLKLKFGVYLTKVKLLSSHYIGLTNIGIRPTFNDNNTVMVETHVIDFNQNIYNQHIELELLTFLRPERKFDDYMALKMQIDSDLKLSKYLMRFYINS